MSSSQKDKLFLSLLIAIALVLFYLVFYSTYFYTDEVVGLWQPRHNFRPFYFSLPAIVYCQGKLCLKPYDACFKDVRVLFCSLYFSRPPHSTNR
jgi:hypothetical protein